MTATLYYPPREASAPRRTPSPPYASLPKMPVSLAPSASVSATNDFIGSPAAGLLLGAHGGDGIGLDNDPIAAANAVGASLRSLSPADATSVLEALAAQAAALSLILAADAGGAIRLPDSLRHLIESAAVLPAFLGGAPN